MKKRINSGTPQPKLTSIPIIVNLIIKKMTSNRGDRKFNGHGIMIICLTLLKGWNRKKPNLWHNRKIIKREMIIAVKQNITLTQNNRRKKNQSKTLVPTASPIHARKNKTWLKLYVDRLNPNKSIKNPNSSFK